MRIPLYFSSKYRYIDYSDFLTISDVLIRLLYPKGLKQGVFVKLIEVCNPFKPDLQYYLRVALRLEVNAKWYDDTLDSS